MSGQDSSRIPVLDLGPGIDGLWDELMGAIQSVVRTGQFIMGPNVKAFEDEAAQYLGVKHAVGMNSGTDALIIALRACGVGPGDEVITTPFTFFATAEAISHLGAKPIFVDIDAGTFNINPDLVEQAITPRTRAILPVHLYGHAAEMDRVLDLARAHGLRVVEDVAQAFGGEYRGRKLGTLGDAGCFSLFPSKNLGAFGDAGLVATNDDVIADEARRLRVHGSLKKYYNEVLGYNSRLDELQAAVLRVKLPHLDRWNEARRRVARVYDGLLAEVPGVQTPPVADGVIHVYHQYTIRFPVGRRDQVQQHLKENGVGTMVYYPVPVHRLPIYEGQYGSLPVAERAATEGLSLPIWPELTEQTQERVVALIREALRDGV